jgi:hypothetical protein
MLAETAASARQVAKKIRALSQAVHDATEKGGADRLAAVGLLCGEIEYDALPAVGWLERNRPEQAAAVLKWRLVMVTDGAYLCAIGDPRDPEARKKRAVWRVFAELLIGWLEELAKELEAAATAATLSAEGRALAVLVQHPDWPATQIAKAVGCHRGHLYRCQNFVAARKFLRNSSQIPKGSKSPGGDLEAWE